MKSSFVSVLLILLLLAIQNSASAQSSFTPLIEEEEAVSFQVGYGILFYKMDLPGTTNDTDLNQYFMSYGFNYENETYGGFTHYRLGYIDPGETKSQEGSSVITYTNWEENHDLSLYFGAGYMHMFELPLNIGDSEDSDGNLHIGGGFDLGGLIFWEKHTDGSTDYNNMFYLTEFQVIALAGMRLPNTNLSVGLSLSLHFVLFWESRKQTNDFVRYDTDFGDLRVQPFGIEMYLVYRFSKVPGLRIGATGKFINSVTVTCFAGYSF